MVTPEQAQRQAAETLRKAKTAHLFFASLDLCALALVDVDMRLGALAALR
jgi:hypothetical protein